MPPKPKTQPILLLGAGELGSAVITSLTKHPLFGSSTLTVLLRPKSPTTAERDSLLKSLTSQNIKVIYADIATALIDQLIAVFSGYDIIISCSGMTYPSGTQVKIAQAVLQARVCLYLPWQFGMDYDVIGRDSSQDLFTEQLDVRGLLRAQDRTRWVIVSTGLFMTFLFNPSFGVVSEDKDTVTALGSWDNLITVTAPQDIGSVVAEVVLGSGCVSGVIHVAGETVSYQQIARYVEDATGKKVGRVLVTKENAVEEVKKDPGNGMKKYRAVFAEGRGVAWDIEETWNWKRGIRLIGVREFLKEKN